MNRGWIVDNHAHVWTLWKGNVVAAAFSFASPDGPSGRPTWAYALFEEGVCIGGASDPAWNLGNAMVAAQAELGETVRGRASR
jgi:hypothetical protein